MKKWMIVTECSGKAVSRTAATVQKYVPYMVPVSNTIYDGYNPILLQIKDDGNDIGIYVSPYEAENDTQTVIISGKDEINLLYAVADFENIYLPFAEESDNPNCVFNKLFVEPLKKYEHHSSAFIRRRGLWTWGHVIYDYKKYIENMVSLKMNDIVIWNDFVPVNISEVIEYAHKNGISIQLGFAWGWDTSMPDISHWQEIADNVIKLYNQDYAHLPCDGIYFQTFTEHKEEILNGLNVAETAVKLVNKVSAAILEINPSLEIQFGLHATSVEKHLDEFAELDRRVSIIWEDAGAFPYSYLPYQTESFDRTLKKNHILQNIASGKNGAVLKGVICLDWTEFEHQCGAYVMGERTNMCKSITDTARRKLRMAQSHWIVNCEMVREMIETFPENSTVLALIEDGYFENYINLPAALYGEIMWNPKRTWNEILLNALRRSDVTMF